MQKHLHIFISSYLHIPISSNLHILKSSNPQIWTPYELVCVPQFQLDSIFFVSRTRLNLLPCDFSFWCRSLAAFLILQHISFKTNDSLQKRFSIYCLNFLCSKRCTASSPVARKAKRTDFKIAHETNQTKNKTKQKTNARRQSPQPGLESLGTRRPQITAIMKSAGRQASPE